MPASQDQTRAAPPLPASPVCVDAAGRLRTDRLELRPLGETDRAAYTALVRASLGELRGRIPLHHPGEDDDAYFSRQLHLTRQGERDRRSLRRLACLIETGEPVGCFNLVSITRGLAWEADAAWWIGTPYTGRGLATEGVRALLAHAFEPMPAGLGLHSVHCGIEATNGASVRVAEKCGFAHKPGKQSHLKVGDGWVMHDFYLATAG